MDWASWALLNSVAVSVSQRYRFQRCSTALGACQHELVRGDCHTRRGAGAVVEVIAPEAMALVIEFVCKKVLLWRRIGTRGCTRACTQANMCLKILVLFSAEPPRPRFIGRKHHREPIALSTPRRGRFTRWGTRGTPRPEATPSPARHRGVTPRLAPRERPLRPRRSARSARPTAPIDGPAADASPSVRSSALSMCPSAAFTT